MYNFMKLVHISKALSMYCQIFVTHTLTLYCTEITITVCSTHMFYDYATLLN